MLPEAALGGYIERPRTTTDAEPPPALDPDGPELRRVMELAGDMVVCVGFCEADGDGARHNVAAVVTGDGAARRCTARCTSRCGEGRSRRAGDALAAFDTRSAGSAC